MVKKKGGFRSGIQHPRYRTDKQLLELLRPFELGTLRSNERIIKKDNNGRYAEYSCISCNKTSEISVYSITRKKTTNCKCQRGWKYPKDGRGRLLGLRYDAMIQRCYRWTHVSSKNYIGRGIEVHFESREDFVFWALNKYPDTDFIGWDFDRIDNNGPYSKHNLRLIKRRVNLMNRRKKSEM